MANEDTQIDAAVEPSNTPEAPVLETPAFVENESNVADGTEGEPPVQEADVSVDVTTGHTSWARRLWWIHSIYALALGVFIALYAGREFAYARWLLLSVIAIWTVSVLLYRTFGVRPALEGEALVKKVGFHAMTWVLKNLYQGMLFFLLPFYWRSTTFGTANQWFLLLLCVCALLATLDIVFDRLLMRFRFASTAYFIVTMFATLNLALPALFTGVDAFYSLVGASVISVLVVWFIHVPRWRWADIEMRVFLAMGLISAVVFSYAARPVIPPVPHHIIHGAVGPGRGGKLLVHASAVKREVLGGLLAETRILAPDGGESSFRHEWMHDGTVIHIVDEPGRMTFGAGSNELLLRSSLPPQVIPDDALGPWSVHVRTDSGRLIGRVRFDVFAD